MVSYAEHSKISPDFAEVLKLVPVTDRTNFKVEDYRHVLNVFTEIPNSLYWGPKDCDVKESTVPGRDGTPVPVRIYTPHDSVKVEGKLPSILFHFHGGGWIGGTLDFGHPHCLWFASHNVIVVNVDYRVTPENPSNVLNDDAYGVYRSIHDAAVNKENILEKWGIPEFDTSKVYLYGTSAGSQIAAACQTIDIEAGRTGVIKGLFLHGLPAVDPDKFPTEKITAPEGNSFIQNKDSPFVDTADIEKYVKWRNSPKEEDKYFNPLVALDDEILKQFPKTYHEVYGMDSLRDGQLLFAERMKELGVQSEVQIWSGYGHCFFTNAWGLEASKGALQKLEDKARWMGVF